MSSVICTKCGKQVNANDLPIPSVPTCKYCQVVATMQDRSNVGRGYIRRFHRNGKGQN